MAKREVIKQHKVIKRSDGKYWGFIYDTQMGWVNDIMNALLCGTDLQKPEDATCSTSPDKEELSKCKIVKVVKQVIITEQY